MDKECYKLPQWMFDVNTCYPGVIKSFDPLEQTAEVEIAIEKYYSGLESQYEIRERPLLVDVPVHFVQCLGFVLTVPVTEGSHCMLFFCQRGYDHWLYEGEKTAGLTELGLPPPQASEFFDVSNAVAVVGFNPIPSAIPNFNPVDAELRNMAGTQKVVLKAGGDVEVLTTENINMKADKDINIEAGGNVNVKGSLIKLN